jgi:hypothetical protein
MCSPGWKAQGLPGCGKRIQTSLLPHDRLTLFQGDAAGFVFFPRIKEFGGLSDQSWGVTIVSSLSLFVKLVELLLFSSLPETCFKIKGKSCNKLNW